MSTSAIATTEKPSPHGVHHAGIAALTLGALGVVFGDIGTSPLYTLKECLLAAGGKSASIEDLFGIISLMVWSLVLVVTVKYLVFIMKADHHGEGGIFSLLALVPERFRSDSIKRGRVTGISLMAAAGAALLYGDGVITPAISVLSAVEGLTVVNHSLHSLVLPITCAILIGLFFIQSRGTGTVGTLFGPVMVVWFTTLAVLGVQHILWRPQILGALSPLHGMSFFWRHGLHGALILGSVVLTVTGGEALYADMGHFGITPIRTGWFFLVFPALILSYLGQGALLLERPDAWENPFFAMVPEGPATVALVILASFATVIASQALISGAFSLTRQAMSLGYFPQMTIKHTAFHTEGQIYIPEINALLGVGCLLLVLTFRESVKLAAAYGIAVTGTMAITSILFYVVARYQWDWPQWKAVSLLVFLLAVDLPFLAANLFKFFDGGYVPMLIGAVLIAAMLIWMRGRVFLQDQHLYRYRDFKQVSTEINQSIKARVPGTAVFLTPAPGYIPPILVHHAKCTKSLHENLLLLTVSTEIVPVLNDDERTEVEALGANCHSLTIRFGYMEVPRIVPVLQHLSRSGQLNIDLNETTYYVGHETTLNTNAGNMGRVAESIFGYLQRNAVKAEHEYGLPEDKVIEIGARIDL